MPDRWLQDDEHSPVMLVDGTVRRRPRWWTESVHHLMSYLTESGFAACPRLSQLLFVYIVIKTIRGGQKATDQVWEGADGLEWTLPSPAPYHSFSTAPDIK
jgi:heme/copper-type cytochrome/quinol oxidase subunit 1